LTKGALGQKAAPPFSLHYYLRILDLLSFAIGHKHIA
jgi:hypothetical protein